MTLAIEVEDVSKRFRLYQDRYTSLKERVIHMGKIPFEDFWALRDINVRVDAGTTLGLLGRNGSGKSTLLKCIAAILQPTKGRIVVRGKLAAMLELGAGFHPELSGKDNIYLNASLLGVPRKEIDRRFDDIVAFAELEQFIDNQVKYYSSGMYTRLGFAVAVNVDPDVLLIDEVLAVGDEPFQRKCLGRIKQFQDDGRTIVFVTHAPDLARQICDHVIVLNQGSIVASGPPGEAIRSYREVMARIGEILELPRDEATAPTARRETQVTITGAEMDHPGMGSRHHLLPHEALTIKVYFEAHETIEDAVFGIAISDPNGITVYRSDTDVLGMAPQKLGVGPGSTTFHFDSVPMLEGAYDVTVYVQSKNGEVMYEWREHFTRFEIVNPGRTVGSVAIPLTVDVESSGDSLSALSAGVSSTGSASSVSPGSVSPGSADRGQ